MAITHTNLMKISAHSIVEKYMELAKCNEKEALEAFYNSELYQLYSDEETKMWHYSSATLADMLYEEVQTGTLKLPGEENG